MKLKLWRRRRRRREVVDVVDEVEVVDAHLPISWFPCDISRQ